MLKSVLDFLSALPALYQLGLAVAAWAGAWFTTQSHWIAISAGAVVGALLLVTGWAMARRRRRQHAVAPVVAEATAEQPGVHDRTGYEAEGRLRVYGGSISNQTTSVRVKKGGDVETHGTKVK